MLDSLQWLWINEKIRLECCGKNSHLGINPCNKANKVFKIRCFHLDNLEH